MREEHVLTGRSLCTLCAVRRQPEGADRKRGARAARRPPPSHPWGSAKFSPVAAFLRSCAAVDTRSLLSPTLRAGGHCHRTSSPGQRQAGDRDAATPDRNFWLSLLAHSNLRQSVTLKSDLHSRPETSLSAHLVFPVFSVCAVRQWP